MLCIVSTCAVSHRAMSRSKISASEKLQAPKHEAGVGARMRRKRGQAPQTSQAPGLDSYYTRSYAEMLLPHTHVQAMFFTRAVSHFEMSWLKAHASWNLETCRQCTCAHVHGRSSEKE